MELNLELTSSNSWLKYKNTELLYKFGQQYIDFLSQNKTERETVAYIKQVLLQHDFNQDFKSNLVFRILHNKSIFIARKGQIPLVEGCRLICAHVDTPHLDLKQHPFYQDCELALAKTHYYGGIKKYQWLAIPLALHGVVIKQDGQKIDIVIGEKEEDPVFTISDLLPHLSAKELEKKIKDGFEAEKLNVILGHIPDNNKDPQQNNAIKKRILKILFDQYAIKEEDLYSAELQLVPAGKARFVGLDRGLIGGYGQDDRCCVFTSLRAFLDQEETPLYTQILMFWDKEEIGSDGSTGAKSLFLKYCLEDLLSHWQQHKVKLAQVFYNLKVISADVHAPIDPNYQDAFDKLNSARLGYGPVFAKFTGHRGKYSANDAHAEYVAWFRHFLNQKNIPWQMAELGKVDLGGGGTVAKFIASYGCNVIDLGPAVLSMHSPFEITSLIDVYSTYRAYKNFLTTP